MAADEKPILERLEKVLAELSRSIGGGEAQRERSASPAIREQGSQPRSAPADANGPEGRLMAAIAWIRARKARDDALGEDLFFDPAWSILLELYVHHRQRTAVSITSLCIAAGVPSSTGLRWMTLLERRGLVVREPDPFDRRKIYTVLTAEAITRVERALDAAAETSRALGFGRLGTD